MLLKKIAVAAAVVGLLTTAAFAQNRQVNVVNNTSTTIVGITVWSPDRQSHDMACSGCPLAPGRSQVVNIPSWNVGTRYQMDIFANDDPDYPTTFIKSGLTVTNGRPDITFTESDRFEEEGWGGN